jgi:hypothetical protein
VIIGVMTMISGMFGMNVQLPLADSPYAFLILLVIMIVMGVLIVRIFKKKKWF